MKIKIYNLQNYDWSILMAYIKLDVENYVNKSIFIGKWLIWICNQLSNN